MPELLGKIDFKGKKIDFNGDLKKYFMDSPHNEIMFDSLGRNNNYEWKIWLQNIIKQKWRKGKWRNPSSSRKDLSCLFQYLINETIKKSVKYIINLITNLETRLDNKNRALY